VITDWLQKYGRPNEATPAKWNTEYKDYDAAATTGADMTPIAEKTSKQDVLEAPPVPPVDTEMEETGPVPVAAANMADDDSFVKSEPRENGSKKRKHEGETAEEKAERKRKKAEKKEKRKSTS